MVYRVAITLAVGIIGMLIDDGGSPYGLIMGSELSCCPMFLPPVRPLLELCPTTPCPVAPKLNPAAPPVLSSSLTTVTTASPKLEPKLNCLLSVKYLKYLRFISSLIKDIANPEFIKISVFFSISILHFPSNKSPLAWPLYFSMNT